MSLHPEQLLRIAVGALLGGVIGFERDIHGRQVGLRTHLIVAMAAATFMVISENFVYFQHYTKDDLIALDPSRIAASIVTGIGFLAGGSILRSGLTIRGLTTAAGLWLVTSIGMCAGAGMYVEGVAVTGMGMLALTTLRRFERREDTRTLRRISLVLGEEARGLHDVSNVLAELGAEIVDIEYDRRLDERKRVRLSMDARIPNTVAVETLLERLQLQPGVRRVRIRGAS